MAIKLFITADQIVKHTSFGGNIDVDSLNPYINIAQKTQLKRILGADLYNKILADLTDEIELVDEYKTIFDEYIVYMLAYFAAHYYLGFENLKVTNNGVNKPLIGGGTAADTSDVDKQSERYKQLATDIETDFFAYMDTVTVTEWTTEEANKDRTQIIKWY